MMCVERGNPLRVGRFGHRPGTSAWQCRKVPEGVTCRQDTVNVSKEIRESVIEMSTEGVGKLVSKVEEN
jgi:hypothetical protein